MSQKTQENFTGQTFFIGLDVHKKQWTVTIRTQGLALKTFSMNPSPEELMRYLHRMYPGGTYKSVYEAGFCGFWIHQELVRLGIENIVIHPPDVPTSHKEKQAKSDPRDSRKLSRELEHHSLTGIYVPSEQQQHLRSLCRLRERHVRSLTRVKNRIKGHLYFYGIPMPSHQKMSHWSGKFVQWLKTIQFSSPPAADYLRLCVVELEEHRRRLAEIMRLLRRYCQQDEHKKPLQWLMSVPGVGPVLAVTLYTELMTMTRFPTLDELAAYVGLVPSVTSSDEHEIDHGLTCRHNQYLRHLLIEAAWVAVRKDPNLLHTFTQLTRRMSKKRAIVRIAKKLLNRIRFVWKHQTGYVMQAVGE
jgi:transposase